jgi:hypothetical protein
MEYSVHKLIFYINLFSFYEFWEEENHENVEGRVNIISGKEN